MGVCYSLDRILKRYQLILSGDHLGQSNLSFLGTVLSPATPKASQPPSPFPGPCTAQLGHIEHHCRSRAAQKRAAGGAALQRGRLHSASTFQTFLAAPAEVSLPQCCRSGDDSPEPPRYCPLCGLGSCSSILLWLMGACARPLMKGALERRGIPAPSGRAFSALI